MQRLKSKADCKKEQRLMLEKWTKCVTDGVQEEWIQRTDRRTIPAPIFGQQNEVFSYFAFQNTVLKQQLSLKSITQM
jgi:hypothetical protein